MQPPFSRKRYRLWPLAVAGLLALAVLAAKLDLFHSPAEKIESQRSLLDQAVGFYEKGAYGDGEQLCLRVLGMKGVSEPIEAECRYLLGKIQTSVAQFGAAKENLGQALPHFEKLEDPAGIYRTQCAMAELALATCNGAKAENHIELARQFGEAGSQDLGPLYYLQAELAFKDRDFQRALAFSQLRYASYRDTGKIEATADSLIDMAFFLILTGEDDPGFENAMEAQELLLKSRNKNKIYYNFINLMILRRCENQGYEALENAIREHLEEGPDYRLQKLLDFALGPACELKGPAQP